MAVIDIVKNALVAMGADGLCNDECGCPIDCLAPCGEIKSDCRPAKKVECTYPDCTNTGCYGFENNQKMDCYKEMEVCGEEEANRPINT